MSLEEYERKRDFAVTSEPSPAISATAGSLRFVVQKHAARRLHYDFRLELDGVLKSWAVPKGPSLDPSQKRLAVHVEDHPLDYQDFEGTIPPGEYGAGTVMVWDRGVWFAVDESASNPLAAYERGRLKFRLEGAKLRGRWMLLRVKPRPGEKGDNWLLFKERDDDARSGSDGEITGTEQMSALSGRTIDDIRDGVDVGGVEDRDRVGPELAAWQGARRAAMPAFIAPELATLVDRPPAGEEWLHEIKLDGYRILSRIDEGEVRFLTRRGADWTERFPALSQDLRRLPVGNVMLDGEVVSLLPDGRTSFGALTAALRGADRAADRIVYFVFDILYLDGVDLTRVPLESRKEVLREVLALLPEEEGRVRYVDHIEGSGEDFYAQACAFALEGEVAKRRDSPYRSGRGRDWVKVKCMHRQEFVVCGFTDRAGVPHGLGALLLGSRSSSGDSLVYAGKVGTGWDERTAMELRGLLDRLRQEEEPCVGAQQAKSVVGVKWVRPALVAEVAYLSWDGAGALRHASFEGLRLDKLASDVVAERSDQVASQPLMPSADGLAPPANGEQPPRVRDVAPADIVPDGPVTVGGVAISNAGRVVYADEGLSKLDLARYYEDIATWMLPHVSRRPLTIVRCPEGPEKECFYQKHVASQFPESVIRVPIAEENGIGMYLAIDSTAGLLSLVQMNVLEFHVWGSHVENLECPDQIVFDFDPDPSLPFLKVISAVRLMREVLGELGLRRSFVKTTGGKGLHVVVPVAPVLSWEAVKPVTRAVAEALVRADPAAYTISTSLRRRTGKIFIDYLRNGRGATSVAPFSTRARPGAPVATPLRWDELTPSLSGKRYTVKNIRRRLAQLEEDAWLTYAELDQQISADMAERARGLFVRNTRACCAAAGRRSHRVGEGRKVWPEHPRCCFESRVGAPAVLARRQCECVDDKRRGRSGKRILCGENDVGQRASS